MCQGHRQQKYVIQYFEVSVLKTEGRTDTPEHFTFSFCLESHWRSSVLYSSSPGLICKVNQDMFLITATTPTESTSHPTKPQNHHVQRLRKSVCSTAVERTSHHAGTATATIAGRTKVSPT